jgi:uncharacterized protein (DUF1697 family)
MPRYIAFLRGINVGGHRVKMNQLRGLFEALKFSNVSTFIASGNVIFEASGKKAAALEERIEGHLQDALGYEVATFLRTPAEVATVAAMQPFGNGDGEAPGHTINVAFLRAPIGPESAERLLSLRTSYDEFHVNGREFFWLCRGKMSDTLIPAPLFAKAVAAPCTMRNLTTIRKLSASYPPA